MTLKNVVSHVVGVAALGAAAAWAVLDVKADTHLDRSTAYGAMALAAFGGWLIDKVKTREFVVFLVTQVKDILSAFVSTPAGSDSGK